MNKLIDLWQNKFDYKIICNDYDKMMMGYYVSKNDFLQKLDQCRMELRSNKNNYDGLIFVFSGHGYRTSIVTSDSLYVSIDKIKRHFGAKQIEKLKDKPKIYMMVLIKMEDVFNAIFLVAVVVFQQLAEMVWFATVVFIK